MQMKVLQGAYGFKTPVKAKNSHSQERGFRQVREKRGKWPLRLEAESQCSTFLAIFLAQI